MMWSGIRNFRARAASAAVRVLACAAVAAAGGLAVTTAAAPALAAQHPAGPTASRTRPATGPLRAASRMSFGRRWTHIAAGNAQTCGIRAGGTLWCWGDNSFDGLGIGSNANDQDLPQQVTTPAPGGWAGVAAGDSNTCATRTNDTLWCWGNNADGELGIGSQVEQDRPQQVTAPARGAWARVTAGYSHTCAIRASGTLWCWGNNADGELGIGHQLSQKLPQQVTSCTHRATQPPARQHSLPRYQLAKVWT